MLASSRMQLAASWLERFAGEPGIELDAAPAIATEGLALSLWNGRGPDVLLLDQALLDAPDAQALGALRARAEALRVLLLCDEPGVASADTVLRHRFHGCLPTQCPREVCTKAIRAVLRGELWLPRALLAEVAAELLHERGVSPPSGHERLQTLTPREQQIVEHLRRGHSNKEIAQELGIREDTVKKHLQSVFGKLGVHRRALVAMRPR